VAAQSIDIAKLMAALDDASDEIPVTGTDDDVVEGDDGDD